MAAVPGPTIPEHVSGVQLATRRAQLEQALPDDHVIRSFRRTAHWLLYGRHPPRFNQADPTHWRQEDATFYITEALHAYFTKGCCDLHLSFSRAYLFDIS